MKNTFAVKTSTRSTTVQLIYTFLLQFNITFTAAVSLESVRSVVNDKVEVVTRSIKVESMSGTIHRSGLTCHFALNRTLLEPL